ncbi:MULTISPECIES: TolC family protein [Hydrogenophaga]|jgi:outer membrane protein, heavy metal efflux system|uniref:TolC family protein n=1 Tax=Hydrogenophaga crocea TaxID=2716225 RepID=A0A6G8IJU1_9BURK|nr:MULTISPECIES: TolC family protein [Hydrogenophaga]QIM53477.1 TolC family protein [Hydrogenophaga crocea]
MSRFLCGPCGPSWRSRGPGALALVFVFVLGLSVPMGLRAQAPSGIDRSAAMAAALQRSGLLKALQAETRAAREMAVAAAQRPDPVLRLSLDNLPVNGADRWRTTRDFMTMRSIGIAQALPGRDKREARARWYEREAQAAHARHREQATEVLRLTSVAWFALRAAQQRLGLLAAQRESLQRQVLAAEAAARSGRGTPSDLLAARDALWRLEQLRIEADARERVARQALERWTGVQGQITLGEPPRLDEAAWVEEPSRRWLDEHPAVQALQARAEVARAAADLAHLERDPDWSVELMLSQRGSAYSDMLSVGVSIPLASNRARRQDRELSARLAEADARDAEVDEARRVSELEIAEWQQALAAALAQLELIDRERLPLARQRVVASMAAYRAGTLSLRELLAAQEAAVVLSIERIDVELDAARPWSALDALRSTTPAASNTQAR